MPLIITLAHQKGGVGKSTLAINLYGYFAKSGHKTAIIDIDPQGSITSLLQTFGSKEQISLFERDSFKSYTELQSKIADYDIVIIDTPPYLSKELQQVLAISHLVLIPCKASPFDALAVVQTIGLVREEMNHNELLSAAIVFTMTISGTNFAGQIREHLTQHEIPILSTEIANRVAYARSLLFSTTVMEDDNAKAKAEIESLGQEIIALLNERFTHEQ